MVGDNTGRVRIAVLGCTGSIGEQTLDIARNNPERVEVVALAAGQRWERVAALTREFDVRHVAMASASSAELLAREVPFADVGSGPEAVQALASLDSVDIVVNALMGAAGLRATVTTLDAGKVLALANKESLVAGGELVMSRVKPGRLLPVDSEHSAIFQCLLGEDPRTVAKIWLTASGGPFFGRSVEDLATITPEQALAHPTWNMGPKITIDSSTLMNKGLEVIEAHHLFDVDYDDIHVVVHRQSVIHSMVEYSDGSVIAHLGATDMRIPIQYALSYPGRWGAPLEPVDFTKLGSLTFDAPDMEVFRCLPLAIQAGRAGGTMPAAMNAANEIAVAAFLDKRIAYTAIPHIVEKVMEGHDREDLVSIEQVEDVDRRSREAASAIVSGTAAR